jgi:hypothetical protein
MDADKNSLLLIGVYPRLSAALPAFFFRHHRIPLLTVVPSETVWYRSRAKNHAT